MLWTLPCYGLLLFRFQILMYISTTSSYEYVDWGVGNFLFPIVFLEFPSDATILASVSICFSIRDVACSQI